jgi:hypothetical protein
MPDSSPVSCRLVIEFCQMRARFQPGPRGAGSPRKSANCTDATVSLVPMAHAARMSLTTKFCSSAAELSLRL